jgi:hypothetical protein
MNKFLEGYYGRRPDVIRKHQACYGGPTNGAAEWLNGYVEQGCQYIVLRIAGDHERQIEAVARMREQLK